MNQSFTRPQRNFLRLIEKESKENKPTGCVPEYQPAVRLEALGLITMQGDKYGYMACTLTPAGTQWLQDHPETP